MNEERSGVPDLIREEFEKRQQDSTLVERIPKQQEDYGIGQWVYERKAVEDAVNSIIEGRYNNQLFVLSKYAKYSVVILEGDLHREVHRRQVPANFITATMVGTFLKRSPEGLQGYISIIPTLDKYQTAAALYFCWRRISTGDLTRLPRLEPIKWTDGDRAKSLVTALPGIADINYEKLLSHFKTPLKLFNATIEEIIEVKGVGETMANNIHKILNFEHK